MSTDTGNILVVDDDQGLRDLFEVILDREGYEVILAESGDEALAALSSRTFDLVLQDLRMPGMDGIELLGKIREAHPDALVVIMTAYSTWETAVEAMRLGAYDYIRKPFDTNDVKRMVARAIRLKRLRKGAESLEDPLLTGEIVGRAPCIREICELVRRVAPMDSTILITGESGTGKELIARAIHYNSLRADAPLITVNCAAFTQTLLESELFGHRRGSFTGAVADRRGLLSLADGGTLFLDEIGDLAEQTQVKLLRVMEQRQFLPVGGEEIEHADVRFVAATNRDLEALVKAGGFREDLYFRLNVIPIPLPALRERKEDVPLLAGRFLARYTAGMKTSISGFSEDALRALVAFDWPGNVRELEHTIQRAVTLADGKLVELRDLPEKVRTSGAVTPAAVGEGHFNLEAALNEVERSYINDALRRTDGNMRDAADLLGTSYRSFRYRVKKLGINPRER